MIIPYNFDDISSVIDKEGVFIVEVDEYFTHMNIVYSSLFMKSSISRDVYAPTYLLSMFPQKTLDNFRLSSNGGVYRLKDNKIVSYIVFAARNVDKLESYFSNLLDSKNAENIVNYKRKIVNGSFSIHTDRNNLYSKQVDLKKEIIVEITDKEFLSKNTKYLIGENSILILHEKLPIHSLYRYSNNYFTYIVNSPNSEISVTATHKCCGNNIHPHVRSTDNNCFGTYRTAITSLLYQTQFGMLTSLIANLLSHRYLRSLLNVDALESDSFMTYYMENRKVYPCKGCGKSHYEFSYENGSKLSESELEGALIYDEGEIVNSDFNLCPVCNITKVSSYDSVFCVLCQSSMRSTSTFMFYIDVEPLGDNKNPLDDVVVLNKVIDNISGGKDNLLLRVKAVINESKLFTIPLTDIEKQEIKSLNKCGKCNNVKYWDDLCYYHFKHDEDEDSGTCSECGDNEYADGLCYEHYTEEHD